MIRKISSSRLHSIFIPSPFRLHCLQRTSIASGPGSNMPVLSSSRSQYRLRASSFSPPAWRRRRFSISPSASRFCFPVFSYSGCVWTSRMHYADTPDTAVQYVVCHVFEGIGFRTWHKRRSRLVSAHSRSVIVKKRGTGWCGDESVRR